VYQQPRPGLAHHVAQQLSAVINQRTDGTFEVALQPEELGRVRISISPQEGGIMIAVQAERGDTIDLMRRHAASLEQAFRDLGNGSVSLSFGHDPKGDTRAKPDRSADGGGDGEIAEVGPTRPGAARLIGLSAAGGLDIRV
jgi:hypothetical protein